MPPYVKHWIYLNSPSNVLIWKEEHVKQLKDHYPSAAPEAKLFLGKWSYLLILPNHCLGLREKNCSEICIRNTTFPSEHNAYHNVVCSALLLKHLMLLKDVVLFAAKVYIWFWWCVFIICKTHLWSARTIAELLRYVWYTRVTAVLNIQKDWLTPDNIRINSTGVLAMAI